MLLRLIGAGALAAYSQIVSVSNDPGRISGGDALLRVDVPERMPLNRVTVKRNGVDVTASFHRDPERHALVGLIGGLRLGQNTVEVFTGFNIPATQISLVNHAITGPIFSGPHQRPFVCQTAAFKLPDGAALGAPVDENCSAKTVVTYMYKSTADGRFRSWPTERPNDIAMTTVTTGRLVPYIVRVETGTINRAIYQIAVLHDPSDPAPAPHAPPAAWNKRLLYTFGGGCVGGWYRQGATAPNVLNDGIVGKGYAEAVSTLNVFGNNCHDLVAAETMMMVKERFIEAYGPPAFTFGRGGSGGSYQQNQIADNYPGLLDGIIPSATFPELLENAQFLTDAQLLNNYFSHHGAGLTDEQKHAIAGVTVPNITGNAAGADRINPTRNCPPELAPELRYHPVLNKDGARCDIFDHAVNIYGRDPVTGFARRVIDNTGVQYGLHALNSGKITVAQFLDLNEKIGGHDNDGGIVANRTVADRQALRAAYQTGRVTFGGNGLAQVPIIDYRGYQDASPKGDVHLKFHSFAYRERLRASNGTIANQVMLVSAPGGPVAGRVQAYAIEKMDEWLTALGHDKSPTMEKIAAAKPNDLVDSCYTASGERIVETQTFEGGECNKLYPATPSPRMVAGGPITNNVLKCTLKPVDFGEYKVALTDGDKRRLRAIFAGGVCDWAKPGVEQQKPLGVWLRF